jgi:hypothetical protein
MTVALVEMTAESGRGRWEDIGARRAEAGRSTSRKGGDLYARRVRLGPSAQRGKNL